MKGPCNTDMHEKEELGISKVPVISLSRGQISSCPAGPSTAKRRHGGIVVADEATFPDSSRQ